MPLGITTQTVDGETVDVQAEQDPDLAASDLSEEQLGMLEKSFKSIYGDLKKWLRATILNGEMLETLEKTRSKLRKRFYVAPDGPRSTEKLQQHFEAYFNRSPATSSFVVDMTSQASPGRSFAVDISYEAWSMYVSE